MPEKPDSSEETLFPMCGKEKAVPTPREERVLRAMYSVKMRVREIKRKKASLDGADQQGGAEASRTLEDELKQLKAKWAQLEMERKEAAKERMIMLGHNQDVSIE